MTKNYPNKILIYSPFFLPKVGGLENMVAMLAKSLTKLGCKVTVICYTDAIEIDQFDYEVLRHPSSLTFLKEAKKCDIFLQFNVSLKGLWPLLFSKCTYFVSHQTSNFMLNGNISFAGRLKQLVTNYCKNIACSDFIANLIPGQSEVIGNSYQSELFKNLSLIRTKQLLFVGRLVSDKGCILILQAMVKLRAEGLMLDFTIVGSGPEEDILRQFVVDNKLLDQVNFAGSIKGADLVALMNQHQIMIVPSIWEEPFGIVALEGLACGCQMIVAKSGGLPEALGTFGTLFEKNNEIDLSDKIRGVMLNPSILDSTKLSNHLKAHEDAAIAKAYLNAFN